jgi:hypothetical protein
MSRKYARPLSPDVLRAIGGHLTKRQAAALLVAEGFMNCAEADGVSAATVAAAIEARTVIEAHPNAVWLPFSQAELRALVDAVGQMTEGNARDYSEWKSQTHQTRAEWHALLRAEATLLHALTRAKGATP